VRVRNRERTITVVGRDYTDGEMAPTTGSSGDPCSLVGMAPVHERVLALRDAGLSAEAIAVILGVAVAAVPALIEIAARKRAKHATAGPVPNPKETTDESTS
jgi:hypothetical protein